MSAQKEQENYQKGIEYSIERTRALGQELAHDFLNAEAVKELVELFNSLLEILDKLIQHPALTGAGLAAGGGIFALVKDGGKTLASMQNLGTSLVQVNNILKGYSDTTKLTSTAIELLGDATSNLTMEQAAQVLSMQGLDAASIKQILMLRVSSDEEMKKVSALVADMAATGGLTLEVEALNAAILHNIKLMATWLVTNPLGWAIMAAGAIVGLIATVEHFTQSSEDMLKTAKEAEDAFSETKNEISSLNGELENTRSRIEEIKQLGSLTLTEEAELKRLEKQASLLERQAAALEKVSNMQQVEAAEASAEYLTKTDETDEFWIRAAATFSASQNGLSLGTPEIDLKSPLEQFYDDIGVLDEENKKLNALLVQTGDTRDENAIKEQREKVAQLETEIGEQYKEIAERERTLYDANGNVIKGQEFLAAMIENITGYYLGTRDKDGHELSLWEMSGKDEEGYKRLEEYVKDFDEEQRAAFDDAARNARTADHAIQKYQESLKKTTNTLEEVKKASEIKYPSVEEMAQETFSIDVEKDEDSDGIADAIQSSTYAWMEQNNDRLKKEQKKSRKLLKQYKKDWEKDVQDAINLGALSKDYQFGDDIGEIIIGNVDTGQRKALQWTEENIEKYGDALASYYEDAVENGFKWAEDYDNVDDYVNSYLGSYSTVDSHAEDFDGIPIAFTPMMVDDKGNVEYLDHETVSNYINGLISQAEKSSGDKWKHDASILLGLDKVENGGKGLLFGQEQDAYASHLVGELGSIKSYEEVITDEQNKLNDSTENFKKQAQAAALASIYFSNGLDDLNNNFAKYKDVLQKAKQPQNAYLKKSAEFSDTISMLRQDLLGLTGISFTTDGIQEFLDDETNFKNLEAAINGSDEALKALQHSADMFVQEHINLKVELGTDEFDEEYAAFREFINSPEVQNAGYVDVETGLDTSGFVQALNTMLKEGAIAASQIQSFFDKINWKVEFEYDEVEIPWVNENKVQKGFSNNQGHLHNDLTTKKIKVPVGIKRLDQNESSLPSNRPTDLPSGYEAPKSKDSGGGGGSEDANKFYEVLDWIEKKLEAVQRAADKLGTIANGTWRKWTERNKALNGEIGKTERLIKLNERAAKRYKKYANSLVGKGGAYTDENGTRQKLSASQLKEYKRMTELVRKGKIGGKDIEGITDETVRNLLTDYENWWKKSVDATNNALAKRDELAEEYIQKFNNIVTKYENKLAQYEHQQNILSDKIARFEAQGLLASQTHLEKQASITKKEIAKQSSEIEKLKKRRKEAVDSGAIEKGSEAWYEMTKQIWSAQEALEANKTELIEINKQIRQLSWDRFDLLNDRMARINSEAQFFIDLMGGKQLVNSVENYTDRELEANDKLFKSFGQLTKEGQATMGMYAVQYEELMHQAVNYAQERASLEQQMTDNPYDQDLIKRYEAMVDAQQDVTKSAEQMKQSMVDLVKQGIDAELSSLSKLIELYEEALDSEKNLYDYQKNVSKQSQNIGSLQKQLSAFQGDNSEENKQRLQKLQLDLKEAQEGLQETEWDHMISEQKKMLADLQEEYSTTLNKALLDTDKLIIDQITATNNNATTISNTIKELTGGVNYNITEPMENILSSSEKMVSFFTGSGYNDIGTAVAESLRGIFTELLGQIAHSETEAGGEGGGTISSTATQDSYNSKKIKEINAEIKPLKQELKEQEKAIKKTKNKDEIALRTIRIQYLNDEINSLELKKKSFSEHARGVRNSNKDEWAWTQDGGREAIIRKDGAILTPIRKGDSVLTAAQTDNLFAMVQDPMQFIKNSLMKFGQTSNVNSLNNNVNIGDVSLNVELPNVSDYKSFKEQLKADKSVERYIQDITIKPLFGASTMKKHS